MQQIISRQEPVKRNLRNHTLYEWMIFEAENIVRYNWSDVAVHDQKLLNKMRPGDTRLWIISEFGSHFLPMYCKLYEKQKQEESEYTFSSVEVHLMRFVKDDRLGQMQSKLLRASSKFYFITKGCGLYDFVITPSDFRSVMDLVFCGNASHIIDNYLG